MKFKVGDEVRVVADKNLLNECCITDSIMGQTGFVYDIGQHEYHGSLCNYQVIGRDFSFIIPENGLELVELIKQGPERTFVGHPDGGLEVKDTKQYGHPRFYEIIKQMEELHSRKNHDYAGTSDPLKNLRACERLELKPFIGVMVRLQDKWSRLEEFIKSGQLMVKGESVKDTLMDNAVYSILAIILYEEQEKVELDYQAAVDHETGALETVPGYGGDV